MKQYISRLNNRYIFSIKCLRWRLEQWSQIVFLDEKLYTTKLKFKKSIKRRRGDNSVNYVNHVNLSSVQQNTINFLTYNSPIITEPISDNFDQHQFVEVLNKYFNSYRGDIVFYFDNCALHKAPAVLAYLISKPNFHVIKTPAYSPDLNCIENIFSINDKRLAAYLNENFINTPAELYNFVLNLNNQISQEIINRLVESMTNRIRECNELIGMQTRY